MLKKFHSIEDACEEINLHAATHVERHVDCVFLSSSLYICVKVRIEL